MDELRACSKCRHDFIGSCVQIVATITHSRHLVIYVLPDLAPRCLARVHLLSSKTRGMCKCTSYIYDCQYMYIYKCISDYLLVEELHMPISKITIKLFLMPQKRFDCFINERIHFYIKSYDMLGASLTSADVRADKVIFCNLFCGTSTFQIFGTMATHNSYFLRLLKSSFAGQMEESSKSTS